MKMWLPIDAIDADAADSSDCYARNAGLLSSGQVPPIEVRPLTDDEVRSFDGYDNACVVKTITFDADILVAVYAARRYRIVPVILSD